MVIVISAGGDTGCDINNLAMGIAKLLMSYPICTYIYIHIMYIVHVAYLYSMFYNTSHHSSNTFDNEDSSHQQVSNAAHCNICIHIGCDINDLAMPPHSVLLGGIAKLLISYPTCACK